MKALIRIRDRTYPLVQISEKDMDDLRKKEVCGVPCYFDVQERIYPHLDPELEHATVEFSE